MMEKTKDESLIAHFNTAISKIKSVMRTSEKEKSDLLSRRTIIGKNWDYSRTSSFLSHIQSALTNFQLVRIHYTKEGHSQPEIRTIEPFAIYHNTSENWVAIAWCRLRNDFRNFRIDRIERLEVLPETFTPHTITLEEYIETQRKKYFKGG
jgi:predicted DNA-binding transcriptional regulator YafY